MSTRCDALHCTRAAHVHVQVAHVLARDGATLFTAAERAWLHRLAAKVEAAQSVEVEVEVAQPEAEVARWEGVASSYAEAEAWTQPALAAARPAEGAAGSEAEESRGLSTQARTAMVEYSAPPV